MSKWDFLIIGAPIALGVGFLFFTEQGKQILAQLTGGSIYDPKTSPFARRGKKGGPMGLEDAREFIPEFLEDVTGEIGQPAQMRTKLGLPQFDLEGTRALIRSGKARPQN